MAFLNTKNRKTDEKRRIIHDLLWVGSAADSSRNMGFPAPGGGVSGSGFLYPVANPLIQGLLFFYGVWVCIHYVPRIIELTGHEDPGQVVADEVAGQSIPMFVLSVITPMHICNAAIMGFALFRIFDILKPWPCKRLEMLPSGWGVVADDVMAGVYAAAVSAVFIRLLPGIFG
jgi:phosphatidylglycerophosphatase A